MGDKTPNLPLQDRGGVQFQSLDECGLKLAEHKNQPVQRRNIPQQMRHRQTSEPALSLIQPIHNFY
jgi:hypothetical protein